MQFEVKLNVSNQSFTPSFGEVHNISDGGYERGYAAGYEDGNTEGYKKGFEDVQPELWNNDSAMMVDYWRTESGKAYPFRNMGLQEGKYRFTVKENLAVKDKMPEDIMGSFCLYIGKEKGQAVSNFLFANSGTTTHATQYEFEVKQGEIWYFNAYPVNKQDILFSRLLIGASLKRVTD